MTPVTMAASMPELLIRPAVPGDRARAHAIAGQAMQAYGLVPDFDGLDADLGQFGLPSPSTVANLAAVRGDGLIGMLVLSRLDAHTAKLSGFYVDAAARGGGAGRALLRHAIALCQAQDYRRIYLETWSAMAAAVSLYEAHGWRRQRRLPAASGAEWSYVLDLD